MRYKVLFITEDLDLPTGWEVVSVTIGRNNGAYVVIRANMSPVTDEES